MTKEYTLVLGMDAKFEKIVFIEWTEYETS